MKTSRDRTADLHRIFSEGSIWKCQQCGLCSGICPSEKAGGIRPIDILIRTSQGVLDLREERSIWLCAMCNSCTERCQMEVDPAEAIAHIRGEATVLGNVPKHFSEEAKLFIRSGLSFPNTGMTKKLRKDLGLGDLEVPAETMEQLSQLIGKTRLGGLKLG
jgi:heterodisulfide reductase subunit C